MLGLFRAAIDFNPSELEHNHRWIEGLLAMANTSTGTLDSKRDESYLVFRCLCLTHLTPRKPSTRVGIPIPRPTPRFVPRLILSDLLRLELGVSGVATGCGTDEDVSEVGRSCDTDEGDWTWASPMYSNVSIRRAMRQGFDMKVEWLEQTSNSPVERVDVLATCDERGS